MTSLSIHRMSLSSHGVIELLMTSGRGQGSGHAYGASKCQTSTLGFWACSAWNAPSELSCRASISLFAMRATLTSSLADVDQTSFFGAGSGWNPVAAPHQLSSRTRTKSVGLIELNLNGPLKTGRPCAGS